MLTGSAGDGSGWGMGATAVGVTLAGAAVGGLLWLRQRRTAVAAAGAGLTVVDEPTVEPAEVDRSKAETKSTVDASAAGAAVTEEPIADLSPEAAELPTQPQTDSPASPDSEPDGAAETDPPSPPA
jgi:hypothetical protein